MYYKKIRLLLLRILLFIPITDPCMTPYPVENPVVTSASSATTGSSTISPTVTTGNPGKRISINTTNSNSNSINNSLSDENQSFNNNSVSLNNQFNNEGGCTNCSETGSSSGSSDSTSNANSNSSSVFIQDIMISLNSSSNSNSSSLGNGTGVANGVSNFSSHSNSSSDSGSSSSIEGTHIRCHSKDSTDGVAHQNLGSHQKNSLDVAAILVAVEVEGTDVEETGIIQTIRVGLIFKLISLVSMVIMPDGLCHPVGDALRLLAIVDVDVGIITDLLKQYLLNLRLLPVKFIATGDRVGMIVDVPDCLDVEFAVLTVAVLIVASAGRKEEGGCARDLIHRVLHLLDLTALPVKVITTEDCVGMIVDVPDSLDVENSLMAVVVLIIGGVEKEEGGSVRVHRLLLQLQHQPRPQCQ
ncbi:unnamed protein product [Caenorhabditis brenneri]